MSEIIKPVDNRADVATWHIRALTYADKAQVQSQGAEELYRSAAGFEQYAFEQCLDTRVGVLNQLAVSGTVFSFLAGDYTRAVRFGYEAIARLGDDAYPSTIEKIMSRIEEAEEYISFQGI